MSYNILLTHIWRNNKAIQPMMIVITVMGLQLTYASS